MKLTTSRAALRVATFLFSVLLLAPAGAAFATTNISSTAVNGTTFTSFGGSAISLASGTAFNATTTLSFAISTTTWGSTGWRIATNTGAYSCVDTVDHTGKTGTFAEPFSVTTPAANGTYNLYIATYSTNDCTGSATDTFSKNGVIQIGPLPDLTISLSNNTSNAGQVGTPFNWIFTVNNTGAPATFASTNVVMDDDLPTGATYGSATAVVGNGTTGTVTCTVSGASSKTLTCTASGSVVIPVGGTITVTLPVTPTSVVTLTSPRSGAGNECKVDPTSNRVTESNESNNTCSNSVVVTAPAVAITPATLTNGTVGVAYDQTLTLNTTATGNFTWSVIGLLPTGLSLSSTTGNSTHIVGTTNTLGTTNFSVKATNGTSSTTQAFALTINPAAATNGTVHTVVTVINDDGGTSVASNFAISATGANATPSNFQGSASGVNVTVDPAAPYSITAAATSSYTASYSANCNNTLAAGDSVTCTVTLNDVAVVTPPTNQAPVATDVSQSTTQDTGVSVVLTATDANNDALTYSVVSNPTNGVLSGTAPTLTYTPNAGFTGSDSFTFKANDGQADSNVATATITVNAVVVPPPGVPAVSITPATLVGGTVGALYTQTLTASTTATGPFNWSVASGSLPAGLTLGSSNTNTVDITGTPTTAATSNFSIFVTNGVSSTTQNFSVTVANTAPTNHAPVAANGSASTAMNASVPATLSATDADSDTLTYIVVSNPTNGVLTGTAPNLTYTPNVGFSGSDSFTFKANDGQTDSNTATYTVTVLQQPANSTGLVVNGNFETPNSVNPNFPEGWTNGGFGTNVPAFTYPEIGIGNTKAVKIVMSSYTDGDAKWIMTPVTVTPGHTYTYTDSYISNVPTQLFVEFTDGSNAQTFNNFVTIPASASTSTFSGSTNTFVVPAGTVSVRVYHALGALGFLTLDDAGLVDAASTTPPAPATISITPTILLNGVVGAAYTQTLTASTTATGPFTWSISSGTLPAGLTLGTTGTTVSLSGTPTVAATSTFTVRVTNGTSSTTQNYVVGVTAAAPVCAANNLVLNCSFETANGATPQNWTQGGYGTNVVSFTYPVTGVSSSSKAAQISITNYTDGDAKWLFGSVAVTPNHAYTYSDSYQSNVPTSLVIEMNTSTGTTFTGFTTVPASATWATSSITFAAPAGAVSARVYHVLQSVGVLTLDNTSLVDGASIPPSITVTPATLPGVIVNTSYNQTLTASTTAAGPFTWSVTAGSLPVGLVLGTSTGATTTITGTPTATSTSNFTISVTNGSSNASQAYSIAVLSSSATVKVVTNMVNDNSGTNAPTDFNITVTGASASPSLFPGSSAGTLVGVASLANYAITTNPGVFYTVTYSPDCNSAVVGSDTVTCTITLDDIPPPPGGQSSNLIKNASLENADPATASTTPLYWNQGGFGTNNRVFTYPVAGVAAGESGTSGNAGKIDITNFTDGDAKWVFQNVPVIPGHTYVFSDNYLSNVPTTLDVGYTNASNATTFLAFVTVPAASASTTWKTASTQFTVPAGMVSVTVYHSLASVGSLTVDNMSITEVAQPISFDQGFVSLTFDDSLLNQYTNGVTALDTKNMKGSFYVITHLVEGLSVQNGNLDQVSAASSTLPVGWSKTGSNSAKFTYPVVGLSGNAAQASSSAAGSNAGWYFTPVTVLPDGIYTFSDDYKSTATTTVVIQVTTASSTKNAQFLDVNGNDLLTATITLPPTGGVWKNVRQYFYIPTDAQTVTVLHRLTGIGSLTIDNMRFGEQGYMTAEQVAAMQADGQEIGSHSQTHAALADVSTARATTEIQVSRQELLAGGNTPVNTIVYPYGSYNTSVEQISQAAGYIGGRSVVPGFNGRNSDKYALLSQSVDADTTLAQIEGWIDQAKANKQWLILTFHGVESVTTGDPYATTPAILQSTVNYLSASSIPVLTMGQGMALMGAPKINVNFTVSNTHGGTATPSNFTATVTGANASPATFQGAATTTVVSIDANTQYSVALQSVPTNYIYATSTSCAGSLQIGTTVTCTISMSDISVNHAPVATNGTAATTANTPTTITLAATDSDANPLTYSIVSAPTHGTLTGTTTSRTYTPTTGFTGTDSFTFVANDGQVNSNIATVTVAVSQPVASTTNLILNPSFVLTSAGLPSNWSQGGWGTNTKTFTYPVTGKTDATAAKVQITAYTSGDEKWVFDKVTVTPAHTYTYTDSYQATIASSLEVEYTSTTGVVSYASVTAVPASAATWGTATLTFTVPAGIASARVFHYITGVGSLTIDDASMTDNAGGSNPVPTVTITPATVPAGTVSQAYSQTLTANTTATGTFSWSVSAGSLPAGITLGASTGKTVSVSGTPTAAGTSNFSVRVTNGTSSTTQSYSLVVNAAGSTTPATNLIPNPSFTNGSANAPTSWSQDFWGTNTRTFTYPVTGKTDATAAKVQITAYTDGDAKWVYNPVTVTAGHTYTYTDSYQSTIGSTLEVEYTSSTGVQTYASETVVPASASAWGTATVTFTVPAGTASARVFHYIAAVGSLTIDDASMTDNAGGSTPPPSNLVLNPSFATANSTDATLPQSWTHGGWGTNTTTFTYPTTGKTDSTAVKVQITAFTSGDAKWVMNSAAVTAGSSYTYADSYQSTVASQLVVEYTSTTNTVSYAGFTSVPVNAAWSTSSITFTAPANTASVRVFHLIAGVGSLTIDDVSLVKN